MNSLVSFNRTAGLSRQIALDIKLADAKPGVQPRISEIAALEMRGGRPTGVEFHAVFKGEKGFTKVMANLRRFIGGDTVVFCPQGKDAKGAEMQVLNKVLAKADQDVIPEHQLQSLRKMTDKMFGEKPVMLDKMADRYQLSAPEATAPEHRALLSARHLTVVYSAVMRDFSAFLARAEKAALVKQPKPTPAPGPG